MSSSATSMVLLGGGLGGRSGAVMEGELVAQLPRRQRPHRIALQRRRGVFQRHQQRDIGRHIARQAPRGGVQVALEEHICHHALQQHHGRQDDDQRAAKEPARQEALDEFAGRDLSHDPAPRHSRRRAPSADKAAAWDLPRSSAQARHLHVNRTLQRHAQPRTEVAAEKA